MAGMEVPRNRRVSDEPVEPMPVSPDAWEFVADELGRSLLGGWVNLEHDPDDDV